MIERKPAIICSARALKASEYVEMPGWEPNYVKLKETLNASRINMIGTIIQTDHSGNMSTFTLDDGTDTLTLRSFEALGTDIAPGTPVLIIGRPRKYGEEVYLMPEIIRPVDTGYVTLRKKLLERIETFIENSAPAPPPVPAPAQKAKPDTEALYELIQELDTGDGAGIADIIEHAKVRGIAQAEKAIHHMLEMGDIFEIKSGRVKIL